MAIGFCAYASWTGMTFFLALTLQDVLGYSPTGAAVGLLPLAIGAYIGSMAAGRLLPRTGPKPLLIVGMALFVSGLVLTAMRHEPQPRQGAKLQRHPQAVAGAPMRPDERLIRRSQREEADQLLPVDLRKGAAAGLAPPPRRHAWPRQTTSTSRGPPSTLPQPPARRQSRRQALVLAPKLPEPQEVAPIREISRRGSGRGQ